MLNKIIPKNEYERNMQRCLKITSHNFSRVEISQIFPDVCDAPDLIRYWNEKKKRKTKTIRVSPIQFASHYIRHKDVKSLCGQQFFFNVYVVQIGRFWVRKIALLMDEQQNKSGKMNTVRRTNLMKRNTEQNTPRFWICFFFLFDFSFFSKEKARLLQIASMQTLFFVCLWVCVNHFKESDTVI